MAENLLALKQLRQNELSGFIVSTYNPYNQGLSGSLYNELLSASGSLMAVVISGSTIQYQAAASGLQTFSTYLTSGVETQLINYPISYTGFVPKVFCTLEIPNGHDTVYSHNISGVKTGSFYVSLSNNLHTSGYKLNTMVYP